MSNENATAVLLEAGSQLDLDIWEKLLILAADHDLIVYPRIALKFFGDHPDARKIIDQYDSKTSTKSIEHCENTNKKELEKAMNIIKYLNEKEHDTQLEDEIIQSINEEVLIKDDDDDLHSSARTPMPRETEKEYLIKMKEEFDTQYRKQMVEKDEAIDKLKEMVIHQDKALKEMKKNLQELTSQTKSQKATPNEVKQKPKPKPVKPLKEERKKSKREDRKTDTKSSKRSRKNTEEVTK